MVLCVRIYGSKLGNQIIPNLHVHLGFDHTSQTNRDKLHLDFSECEKELRWPESSFQRKKKDGNESGNAYADNHRSIYDLLVAV